MLVDIPDDVIARVALGLNGRGPMFSYHSGEAGSWPLLVEMQHTAGGIRFIATRKSVIEKEVTLSLVEIFDILPRLSRLLSSIEGGAA